MTEQSESGVVWAIAAVTLAIVALGLGGAVAAILILFLHEPAGPSTTADEIAYATVRLVNLPILLVFGGLGLLSTAIAAARGNRSLLFWVAVVLDCIAILATAAMWHWL